MEFKYHFQVLDSNDQPKDLSKHPSRPYALIAGYDKDENLVWLATEKSFMNPEYSYRQVCWFETQNKVLILASQMRRDLGLSVK